VRNVHGVIVAPPYRGRFGARRNIIAQIDTSVVSLAVRPIGADLGATVSDMQWMIDAYNLVYASLLLTGGTLGDLYGRRRVFVWGIALFALGSALVAAALCVAGGGLGLNTAAVNSVAVSNAPRERSGTASGLFNTARLVGATLGVAILGAVFAHYVGQGASAEGFVPRWRLAVARSSPERSWHCDSSEASKRSC
jgi:MFS family permease